MKASYSRSSIELVCFDVPAVYVLSIPAVYASRSITKTNLIHVVHRRLVSSNDS